MSDLDGLDVLGLSPEEIQGLAFAITNLPASSCVIWEPVILDDELVDCRLLWGNRLWSNHHVERAPVGALMTALYNKPQTAIDAARGAWNENPQTQDVSWEELKDLETYNKDKIPTYSKVLWQRAGHLIVETATNIEVLNYDQDIDFDTNTTEHLRGDVARIAMATLPAGVFILLVNEDEKVVWGLDSVASAQAIPARWALPSEGVFELVHPDDHEKLRGAIASGFTQNAVEDSFMMRVRPHANTAWMDAVLKVSNVIPTPAGNRVAVVLQIVDGDMAVAAARTRLFRTVAHELRAPLATITGRLDLLDSQLDALKAKDAGAISALKETAQYTRAAALRMQRLTADLLDNARMELGDFSLQKSDKVDLNALLDLETESQMPDADAKSVTMTSRKSAGPPIKADPLRLSQLFSNLISNAIKYNVDGGAVAITSQATGVGWLVRIVDTGIGMSDSDLQKLGDPLFRTESSREYAVGTGLGFSVCKGIVEAHDGTLEVESERGQGTTVSVFLPTGE